jgi:hypothetical protein
MREKRRGEVVELRFLVDDEQPDDVVRREEVDDPCPAPLSGARDRPTNLPAAAAARNDASCDAAMKLMNAVRSASDQTSVA